VANEARGEREFEAYGKRYVLKFSANALAELEAALGIPILAMADRFSAGNAGVRELRALLWAGLSEGQPGMTLLDAGRLIDEVGIREVIGETLAAFEAAFPLPKTPAQKETEPASLGTGASTS
jgi:hypothetical protein